MGVSGWGVSSIITILIAVGFGFICVVTPMWFTNVGVAHQHDTIVQSAEASVGLIGMCFDVQFKGDKTNKYKVKECYPYFGGAGGSYRYIGHTNLPSFQEHKSDMAICSYYFAHQGANKAAKEISIMTGTSWVDIDFFLQSTCGSLGKASIAMAVLFLALTFFTLVALVFVVFCCKHQMWLITFARVSTTLAAISSGVLTFCLMSQVKGIKSAGDGVDVRYGFCFYFEWVGLFFVLVGSWCIEKHAMSQKAKKVDLI
ncbi:hypothetical protein DYB25_010895 [Aphanomyces astaci]|uniref:Uncharacterized protein n=2 Tax=Aphanomyces astaci TaxID=112090 RepID=A0A397AGC0_APHAT|nr:hypothetical protein DYB36_011482 [Aphanomyces astaci]RHY11811.1 hypothetical protein DYB25_010895 [Aphanomyces astaci]RHY41595.1 hypothetical protein DYB38_008866 [Aphanomyces astaci]RHY45052.1 hypothetical protein DYB30_004984 [Aphanomyces astaci]RHY59678.1 hypothetical protein DYB34_013445 [Aphanomyces astaci]